MRKLSKVLDLAVLLLMQYFNWNKGAAAAQNENGKGIESEIFCEIWNSQLKILNEHLGAVPQRNPWPWVKEKFPIDPTLWRYFQVLLEIFCLGMLRYLSMMLSLAPTKIILCWLRTSFWFEPSVYVLWEGWPGGWSSWKWAFQRNPSNRNSKLILLSSASKYEIGLKN